MARAAFGARPLAYIQRHGFTDVTTGATSLTGRKPAVNSDQFLAVPFALVSEQPTKRAETRSADCYGETVVLGHPRNTYSAQSGI